jgi:hypothetical protein
MPVDIPDSTAGALVTATTGVPIQPIASTAISGFDPSKKMAELSLKAKTAEEFDPTDNDTNYLFELTKIAIQNGAKVVDIDLKALIPAFQEDTKQKTKKYTYAKIVSFFTGGTFMFLMYLVIDYLKTI